MAQRHGIAHLLAGLAAHQVASTAPACAHNRGTWQEPVGGATSGARSCTTCSSASDWQSPGEVRNSRSTSPQRRCHCLPSADLLLPGRGVIGPDTRNAVRTMVFCCDGAAPVSASAEAVTPKGRRDACEDLAPLSHSTSGRIVSCTNFKEVVHACARKLVTRENEADHTRQTCKGSNAEPSASVRPIAGR